LAGHLFQSRYFSYFGYPCQVKIYRLCLPLSLDIDVTQTLRALTVKPTDVKGFVCTIVLVDLQVRSTRKIEEKAPWLPVAQEITPGIT